MTKVPDGWGELVSIYQEHFDLKTLFREQHVHVIFIVIFKMQYNMHVA